MNPQRQFPTQPQMSAEQIQKNREYLKQQQKLRLMASSTQKTHQVSADSLIENLLGKKDTFAPTNSMTSAYLPASNEKPASAPKVSPTVQPGKASIQQTGKVDWLSPNSPNFPAIYNRVWSLVGQPDGMADTGRLFPLLLTSGLHTDVLGFIWGLVNRCVAGKLTELELYSLLALVALAQRGYSFNSVDVLSLVPQPPIPNLNLVVEPQLPNKMTREELNLQPQAAVVPPLTTLPASLSLASSTQHPVAVQPLLSDSFCLQTTSQNISNDFDDFDDFQSATTEVSDPSFTSDVPVSPQQNVLPILKTFPSESLKESAADASTTGLSSIANLTDIPEPIFVQKFPIISVVGGGHSIGSRLANHSLGAPKTNKNRHHKHHPPNANQQSMNREPALPPCVTVEDDFSDFQQACSDVFSKCSIKPPPMQQSLPDPSQDSLKEVPATKTPEKKATEPKVGNELMGMEDRYGALRALSLVDDNPTEAKDDFGDFFSTEASTTENDSFADLAIRSSTSVVDTNDLWGTATVPIPGIVKFEVDDWGSFATASDSVSSGQIPSPHKISSSEGIEIVGDWGGDSSLINNTLSTQLTELNLDFKLNPLEIDSKIISAEKFDTGNIAGPRIDLIKPINSSIYSLAGNDILSVDQNDEDDFGDFVGTDHAWSKDGNILLESNSWIEDVKEVDTQSISTLWLDETKAIDSQSWPEEVKYDQAKISKDGMLDNHLVSNLWLEESKALDNQSVRSLELPGLDQSWNAVGEWRKCLQTCLTILQFAVDTFESVSDPKVMQEILNADEGKEYLKGLVEIWTICERLISSCRNSGVEHKLDALLNSTESAWSLLRPHFTQAHIAVASEMELEGEDSCSICLGIGAMLEFEGCMYHTACANLWLNYIDTVLPAIHQPQ